MSKQTWICYTCNKNNHRTNNKCTFCNTWRQEEGKTKNNEDNTSQSD